MKKILFTDLDGTLLNNDKLVSQGNREAIERLLEAGHYFVVATGRPTKSAFKVVEKLGLTMPGCYMIAYNGGVIFDCHNKELVMEKKLPLEYVHYLFKEAEKYGLYIQTYGEDDKIIANCDGPELKFYTKGTSKALSCEICSDIQNALCSEPNKALFIDLSGERNLKFWEEHKDWEAGRCESTFSCKEYLEYLPLGVSKGNAVRTLCEMLEVDIQNAYAAGDERNDISMIEAAGVGVAMKNAVDEAKSAADYITENDNNNDGIAEIIDKLILRGEK